MDIAFGGVRLDALCAQRRAFIPAAGVFSVALGAMFREEQAAGLDGLCLVLVAEGIGFLPIAGWNL